MSQVLLLTLVGDFVRDSAEVLSAESIGRALDLAVQQYGRDRPRAVVVDINAAGGHLLDYPDGFAPEASTIIGIEYPLGEVPPALLSADLWTHYQTPDGPCILSGLAFSADAVVRVTYTAAPAVDDIPVVHLEAVATYAAALLHDQLASAKSGDNDSTLNADSVRTGSKGKEYAERAATQRKRYHDLLGIDPKRVQGASVVVPLASPAGDGGTRFWHGRGRR